MILMLSQWNRSKGIRAKSKVSDVVAPLTTWSTKAKLEAMHQQMFGARYDGILPRGSHRRECICHFTHFYSRRQHKVCFIATIDLFTLDCSIY